jgi:hypothetical protein
MENFYEKCAEILGSDYSGKPFLGWCRNRWNNREAGRGRYEGFGIIRKFGDQIHVSLRNPVQCNKIFENEEKVLDYLRSLV